MAPIAALGQCQAGVLHLRGLVSTLDGRCQWRREIRGAAPDAVQLGQRLAEQCRASGARAILAAL